MRLVLILALCRNRRNLRAQKHYLNSKWLISAVRRIDFSKKALRCRRKPPKQGVYGRLGLKFARFLNGKSPVKEKCLPVRKLAECAALIDEKSLKRLNSELREVQE